MVPRFIALLIAGGVFLLGIGLCAWLLPIRPRLIITSPEKCELVGFDPTGQTLITRANTHDPFDARHWAWDVATGVEVPMPDLPLLGAIVSWRPNQADASILYPFQVSEQKPNLREALPKSSWHNVACISPDRLAVAFHAYVLQHGWSFIVVWDSVNDQRLSLLTARNLNLCAVAPAGRLLACTRFRPGVANADLVLLEPLTGKEHSVFPEVGHSQNVRFSPDSSSLAGVFSWKDVSGYLRVWDVRSSQLLLAAENVGSFSFSPDGRHVIRSVLDGSFYSALHAWDIGTPDQRAKSATLEKEVPIKHLAARCRTHCSRGLRPRSVRENTGLKEASHSSSTGC
jgi:WD40 repeat protein